ncbi:MULTISPECIES: DUF5631 domain-containing protein [Mycolicibacter]|uniref:Vegetative cell wall protein n=1 Tax=Mycolicibacter virginiensis TaxID=1795032 RepID=A0A9X7IL10_9MYCO|nr:MULTISPECIES: DUF5631 domain-containing protein [Mycolicibacter]OBJ28529.1 hypothetical protein A5631_20840 [Mycolicibacter heraklionensis]PQM51222.1 hypothetical protein C5U48_16170 [Mycolicibacter virginiensis]ULP47660.1 DUF5631 domain-containing protein [Mycolicibacter virginiensis]
MALFGRRSARQRLRNAARESLTIPAFSAPVDCSSWVLGGLWPAELATLTPETAPLADYLNADLQRIAQSANEKLHAISRSDLAGPARQAAETRVINVARAFAVLRVESTVRQLHKEALDFGGEYVSLNAAPAPAPVVRPAEAPVEPVAAPRSPEPPEPPSEKPAQRARHRLPKSDAAVVPEVAPLDPPPVTVPPAAVTSEPSETPPQAPEIVEVPATPEVLEPERFSEPYAPPTAVIDSAQDQQPPTAAFPTEAIDVSPVEPVEPVVAPPVEPIVVPPVEPAPTAPHPPAAAQPEPEPVAPTVAESGEQRLQRLLAFVARQEPGLRWAIGAFADGTTRLVTDIAYGWVPSGIELPDGVQLLEPGRRNGTATEMLGNPTESASYSPGDRLGWASDFAVTETSVAPRKLEPIDDLGWRLSEATHWREGLPRMANTLVKAGAAGTGVVDAEIDLLRVHLDTMRYQLLAQYPDSDSALVLNCMLLAASEGMATGDTVSANYHYSWFQTLTAPPTGPWDSQI